MNFLGLYPYELLGKQLEELLDIEQISFIQNVLPKILKVSNPLINTQDKTLVLMVLFIAQISLVLELEHTASKKC